MSPKTLAGSIIAVIVALVAAIIYALTGTSSVAVTDYASCVKDSNKTVNTSPAECVTADGRVFLEPAATETPASAQALPAY